MKTVQLEGIPGENSQKSEAVNNQPVEPKLAFVAPKLVKHGGVDKITKKHWYWGSLYN